MALPTSKKQISVQKLFIFILYCFIITLFGGPVLWLISLSLRTTDQLFTNPPQLLPSPLSIEAYKYIFRGNEIIGFLLNSLKVSGATCCLSLLIGIPGAYALSRFRIRFKREIMIVILLFKMISPLIIVVPMYRYFSKIGIVGSHMSAILVYTAAQVPFIAYLLKGFFDSIPYSIEESAMMDGCSRVGSLLRIVLPISASGLFSAFIFVFLMSWSEFVIPFILLDSTKLMPLSVGIYLFQESRASVDTHIVSAITTIAIIPPIILFWFLQKYIVQVLTAGAVKE
jgi:multiple sugar transport system permease protein